MERAWLRGRGWGRWRGWWGSRRVLAGQGGSWSLVTPLADGRCLPGVMRSWLLEAAPRLGLDPQEEPLSLDRLREADEVWLTGSVAGVRRVSAVAGRSWGRWPVWEHLAPLGVPAPGWPAVEHR